MSAPDVLRAAVAGRVAAAYPAALDISDRTYPPDFAKLPAFAVHAERRETRPLTNTSREAEDRVEVSLWVAGPRSSASDMADAVSAAVLAAPTDLGGLVGDLQADGTETEQEDRSEQVARATVAFSATYRVAT